MLIKIKNLKPVLNKKGNLQSFVVYLCTYCNTYVERFSGTDKKCDSCGCQKDKHKYKHGESRTKLYHVYHDILQRCLNINDINYKNYGGRSIKVCNEWLEFISFRDWALKNGYKKGLQIDRINNNGNYEPNNCRFVTSQINNQNQRTTKLSLEKANEIRELYKTDKYTRKQIAEIYNVDPGTIYRLINNKIWKNI